jgi:hypothetical protein
MTTMPRDEVMRNVQLELDDLMAETFLSYLDYIDALLMTPSIVRVVDASHTPRIAAFWYHYV